MTQRDLTELIELFGREAVDDAVAHEIEAGQYAFENSEAIVEASAVLQNKLGNLEEMTNYTASLDPQLRRALIVVIMNM